MHLEAVNLVVPPPWTSEQESMHRNWLNMTRIRVRCISFETAMGGLEGLAQPPAQSAAAKEFVTTPSMIAASVHTLQVRYHSAMRHKCSHVLMRPCLSCLLLHRHLRLSQIVSSHPNYSSSNGEKMAQWH